MANSAKLHWSADLLRTLRSRKQDFPTKLRRISCSPTLTLTRVGGPYSERSGRQLPGARSSRLPSPAIAVYRPSSLTSHKSYLVPPVASLLTVRLLEFPKIISLAQISRIFVTQPPLDVLHRINQHAVSSSYENLGRSSRALPRQVSQKYQSITSSSLRP